MIKYTNPKMELLLVETEDVILASINADGDFESGEDEI